jgi:glycosidase
MPSNLVQNSHREARRSFARLLPRIEPLLAGHPDRDAYLARLDQYFPDVFHRLHALYGDQYDFFWHLEQILATTAEMSRARPTDLQALDSRREADPLWFQSENMLGGVCYVDLFAGDLNGLRERIPYFRELGLTYLHLMPLFRSPEGNNDGGYAISNYREVDPRLGTMRELSALAADLRAEGMSLVLDFVFNHTASDHEWARRAIAGDEDYEDFYFIFPDRSLPDRYEFDAQGNRILREIFPDARAGNFTYLEEYKKWVWTTFYSFQWDLNYRNPAVFNAMLGEMLALANNGVEILRLDAVAFIWKQIGTGCENLPQVHTIIQALNALCRIAAPAMLFKSEAIVHPREVASYISWGECPISYNPTLMALCWEALATREVKLLLRSMQHWFTLPQDCAWVNYIRSHDDIGWSFADEDAWTLNINGYFHRQFLNQFYSGQFGGTFARGLPFNYNPVNQDMRISGTCASLAGLESALEADDPTLIEHAVKRILLLYAIPLCVGGIPLIYLGDELGTLNNYDYQRDPTKASDSRWVHRSPFDWKRAAQAAADPAAIPGRIYHGIKRMIEVRKNSPALANGATQFLETHNPHVFAFTRQNQVLFLGNFSEYAQDVSANFLADHGFAGDLTDLLTGKTYPAQEKITLGVLEALWLKMPANT